MFPGPGKRVSRLGPGKCHISLDSALPGEFKSSFQLTLYDRAYVVNFEKTVFRGKTTRDTFEKFSGCLGYS